MRIYIFHYDSYLKGSYDYSEFDLDTPLYKICDKWTSYFKNELNVWKFKPGMWFIPYDELNPYFNKDTTLKQYIEFYLEMDLINYVYIIFK
jgi:hypothetical protein